MLELKLFFMIVGILVISENCTKLFELKWMYIKFESSKNFIKMNILF